MGNADTGFLEKFLKLKQPILDVPELLEDFAGNEGKYGSCRFKQ